MQYTVGAKVFVPLQKPVLNPNESRCISLFTVCCEISPLVGAIHEDVVGQLTRGLTPPQTPPLRGEGLPDSPFPIRTPMVINAPYDLSGEPGFKSLAGEGSGANSEVVLY
jgi:hypothetical protein